MVGIRGVAPSPKVSIVRLSGDVSNLAKKKPLGSWKASIDSIEYCRRCIVW